MQGTSQFLEPWLFHETLPLFMGKELDFPDTGFGRSRSPGLQYWLSETCSHFGPAVHPGPGPS